MLDYFGLFFAKNISIFTQLLFTVDICNLYSNLYQPTFFNASSQATTSTLYDNVTQPQYNACYVLDDDNSGEISNGRKSTDYVVDHVDDYDLGQTSPATAFEDGQQRKRSYSGGEEAYGAKKVIRQQVGSASVHDAQQSLIGAQRVKQEKDLGYGKVPAVAQQSLLKGQKPVTTNKKTIKQEKDLYSYGKHENSVPDITTTNASTQGAATSPSSSNGSGKSFYSKDDLFTDDVPNELFGDDANTVHNYNFL